MTENTRRHAYEALQTALDRRDEGRPADEPDPDEAYAPASAGSRQS